MPTWSHELPADDKHMGFDLRRTPQIAPLHAIITCENMIVCDTHYWGGRTLPCERKQILPDGSEAAGNCPACKESIPFRTHVYVSALAAKTLEHFLFECTKHAARALAEYHAANATLRACMIHAQRPKGKPNSPVVIQCSPANQTKIKLPEPPNVIKALCVIWRVPFNGTPATEPRHGHTDISAGGTSFDRMREQPDNQPEPERIADILLPFNVRKANGHERQ